MSPASARDEAISEPLAFAQPDPALVGPTTLALFSSTLNPGAEDPASAASDRLVAVVDEGEFGITVDGPAALKLADDIPTGPGGTLVPVDEELTIEAGGALSLPPGTAMGLRNDGVDPAAALDSVAGELADEDSPPWTARPSRYWPSGPRTRSHRERRWRWSGAPSWRATAGSRPSAMVPSSATSRRRSSPTSKRTAKAACCRRARGVENLNGEDIGVVAPGDEVVVKAGGVINGQRRAE